MKEQSWQSSSPAWTCENCPAHHSGVFSDLSGVQLQELEKGRVLDQFKKGQVLFYEGHHPLAAYCLLSGQVKVYKTLSGCKRQVLHLASSGDFLGHESLLRRDAYQVTAEAMVDSHVCTLPRSIILPILEKSPPTLLRLIDRLSDDLAKLENASSSYSLKKSVSARLALLLLDLNQRFGRPNKEGSSLELALSRAEMAGMVGTTTETTIRTLNDFQSKGFLKLGRQRIEIKDSAALQALAE
jgi:CRP/FNR family transcriptional regulator